MPVVIGVDSSTQSTKVEVRDADSGALLASGHAPHPPTTPPRSEQDPHSWWRALGAALDQCGSVARDAAAIAIGAQQHGLLALGVDGEPLRPAKLWNDTQSAADARWLLDQLPGRAADWARACGSVPVASFTITKLSWLHRSEPDVWTRVARVCLPHDWLTSRLAGALVTDRGDASGTGWFSAATNEYRLDLLEIVDAQLAWRELLPRVLEPLEPAGTTGAFGMRDAIVGPGSGDNMCAALGIGLMPGDVAISCGTSGVVFAVCNVPTFDATGAVAGFADATGRFLPLVCTLNATKVTDTLARLLGVDHPAFDALALAAAPGASGTVVVPYFDGERTPNRPAATGHVGGLRSDTSRDDLARAAVEGVVCGLLDALDSLRAAGVPAAGRVVFVGGGARSAAYRRVLADLAGCAIHVPRGLEHVATGACVQAAAVLHGRDPTTVRRAWTLDPDIVVDPDANVDRDAIRDAYRWVAG